MGWICFLHDLWAFAEALKHPASGQHHFCGRWEMEGWSLRGYGEADADYLKWQNQKRNEETTTTKKRQRQQNETNKVIRSVQTICVLYQTSYKGGWVALASSHRKKMVGRFPPPGRQPMSPRAPAGSDRVSTLLDE